MGKIIRYTILIGIVGICTFMFCKYKPTIVVNQVDTILSSISEDYDIELLSDNSCYCDLKCVTNIILLMQQDGYSYVLQDYELADYMVYTVYNNEDQYRLIYNTKDRKLLVVAKDYIKSYIPLTYVNKKGA